ncbi:MAG: ABC transporter ATP-binding protein [Paenibacillus sp.]|uniref:ABC transporter ATP-binding protein n=1 Tax=Paenibacillus timonensis TaxID=225915 RepID=A0ABW3SD92_9BACL|nr:MULTISPECIES: ABC transporter ATP-binding protein [Paenibacillus]MCH1640273.1 ABC transporter ATP-binding protein [Paenibacillus timonensis]MDU4697212.1 ABC transporter ATP-binding protein [Paenibacillus sp.]
MILEATGLTKKYKGLTAVDSYRIQIKPGQIHGLIGPNGAGKTTVFNMLTSLVQPTEGKVFFQGNDISGKRPDEIAALGLARTFQNIRLFKGLTVLENVMVAAQIHKRSGLWATLLRFPSFALEEKNIRSEAENLLESVGLEDVRDVKAGSLPYGSQRKLEIARALALRPSLLLLDEPAAGMNHSESAELTSLIRDIRDRYDLSILLIEHDIPFVMNLCDHLQVLSYGKLIAEGDPQTVRSHPEVIEAYLGRSAEHA